VMPTGWRGTRSLVTLKRQEVDVGNELMAAAAIAWISSELHSPITVHHQANSGAASW
jgi:hypothetical protein